MLICEVSWFTAVFISLTPLSGLSQCMNLQYFFLVLKFVYCLMSLGSFVFFILVIAEFDRSIRLG